MAIRNPIFTADNRIDCEIEHPDFGWIPFTADPNDVEPHGRDIYAAALQMGPAAYVPPPPAPEPVPHSITFAQLLIGLVAEQWMSEADGDGWLSGTLPAPVLAVIGSLPESQRFAARARALRPSEVQRADPLLAAMGVAVGKTEAEIDTFFRTYSQV
jgi:hypothetical protein